MDYIMGIISAPPEKAVELARQLVADKLAACAQVTSPVESFYWWEEKVQSDPERLIYLKTRTSRVAGIREFLARNHPYDVPEFITLPLSGGHPAYLKWLGETLS